MEKFLKIRYKNTMMQKNIDKNKLMKTASHASMATATLLIVLKLITFLITGSMAILSSLFDSIQDAMTSTVNLIAIRHATEPADKEHSFGHGKAHALGGVSQAFIIAIASLFLLKESIHRLFDPQEITQIKSVVLHPLYAPLNVWNSFQSLYKSRSPLTFPNHILYDWQDAAPLRVDYWLHKR